MLSYRHAFHAGNPADVLKHIVLVRCLEYFNQKDKPYCYLDTHAGAGRYRLDEPSAQKTGEYQQGIARLWHRQDIPGVLDGYLNLLRQLNSGERLNQYPGSPWLARALMREQDRGLLHELHPKDFALLGRHFGKSARFQVRREDGFAGCIAAMPPKERRAIVLMDPSYEVKEDYQHVVDTLEHAHRRFSTGTYLIWYPVVDRPRVAAMERAVKRTKIRNVKLYELATGPDTAGRGMTASGMIVVNPPWTLEADMAEVLPYLTDVVAPAHGRHRSLTLAAE